MAEHYSYKPALLVAARHYSVDDTQVICTDKTGAEKWRMGWAEVTRAAYVEYTVKATRMRRLDLQAGPKATEQTIGGNGGMGDPSRDPDTVAQLDLIAAIATRLADRDEGFQVTFGEYGRARRIIFVFGIVAMLSAVGLTVLTLVTGVSSDGIIEAAVPFGVVFVMGVLLFWSNAPWRPVPQMSARGLAEYLRRKVHPADAPE